MFASTFAKGHSRQGVGIVGDSRQGVCLLKVIVGMAAVLQTAHVRMILNNSRSEPQRSGCLLKVEVGMAAVLQTAHVLVILNDSRYEPQISRPYLDVCSG